MRIAFAGTPSVAIPTLDSLIDSEHEVVCVITQPPAPQGRSKKLVPSAVAEFASSKNLTIFDPESINTPESIEHLKSLNVDIAVVVAYGQLLKPQTLAVLPRGWINAHFSLLPTWRGAAPVQAAIIHGDELTGVTTFQLEAGMDTGPIYGQVTTEINSDETAGQLLERLSHMGADLVLKTLDAISAGESKPVPQSESEVSYAPKLLPKDGQIKWAHPALAISRHIRGFTPSPGAWTVLDDNRIEVAMVEICEHSELSPGELRMDKNEVFVGTGSTDVKLTDVKPAGKGWMQASAWARGLRTSNGVFQHA
jgi:methionyl-tRNA formyltransferase